MSHVVLSLLHSSFCFASHEDTMMSQFCECKQKHHFCDKQPSIQHKCRLLVALPAGSAAAHSSSVTVHHMLATQMTTDIPRWHGQQVFVSFWPHASCSSSSFQHGEIA